MVTLHCCGEEYYAAEQHVGNYIRCRKCGRFLAIRAVSASPQLIPRLDASSGAARTGRTTRSSLLELALAGIAGLGILAGLATFTHRSGQATKALVVQTPALVRPAPPHPIVPERVAVSLPTGTWVIRPRGVKGQGILKIYNGTGLDAAAKLVTATAPRKTIWLLYIRANEEKAVSGIGVGTYLLRFALGVDWDASTRKFLQSPEFYEAGEQFDFKEESSSDGHSKYTEIELTLNQVPFGNLPRKSIKELTFNEGDDSTN